MRVVAVAVVFLCAAVSLERPSAAGPTEDAARDAAKKGAAAFDLGSFEEAAGHYEQAYRLVPDYAVLYNIGQSWRLAAKPERALNAYRSYLRRAPPDAPHREQVERRVTELERIVADTKSTQSAPPPGVLRGEAATAAPATPASTTAPVDLTSSTPEPAPTPPVYTRWWFWTGAAAVVAGAVVGAIVLSSGDKRATSCGAGVDYCAPVRR